MKRSNGSASYRLSNSTWLRDEISKVIGAKPWVIPVVVFTNAFVSGSRPVKGVKVINKKFLLSVLQKAYKPNPDNARIWEKRELLAGRFLK